MLARRLIFKEKTFSLRSRMLALQPSQVQRKVHTGGGMPLAPELKLVSVAWLEHQLRCHDMAMACAGMRAVGAAAVELLVHPPARAERGG